MERKGKIIKNKKRIPYNLSRIIINKLFMVVY